MVVMRGLVQRLREADRKIGSLALHGRLRAGRPAAARDGGERRRREDRHQALPKQDIAKMIGASREMVSRVMKDLQMGGYIEMRGSNIVLATAIDCRTAWLECSTRVAAALDDAAGRERC